MSRWLCNRVRVHTCVQVLTVAWRLSGLRRAPAHSPSAVRFFEPVRSEQLDRSMERDPRPLEVIVALICGAADVPQNIVYCFTGDPRFNVSLRVSSGTRFYTHKTLCQNSFHVDDRKRNTFHSADSLHCPSGVSQRIPSFVRDLFSVA